MRNWGETSTEAKLFRCRWVVFRPLEPALEIDRTRLTDGWQGSQLRVTSYGIVDTNVPQAVVGHGRKWDRARCGVSY
jgi:hypothetical protein